MFDHPRADNTFPGNLDLIACRHLGEQVVGDGAHHLENIVLGGVGDTNGGGNALDNLGSNVLLGYDGNDTLACAEGNDTLAGRGADRLLGGTDDDRYVVDHRSDQVVELANEGIDTVSARISHILADHVENLSLVGTAPPRAAAAPLPARCSRPTAISTASATVRTTSFPATVATMRCTAGWRRHPARRRRDGCAARRPRCDHGARCARNLIRFIAPFGVAPGG
jgi:hypothetical protein